jgi:hypothetical protein
MNASKLTADARAAEAVDRLAVATLGGLPVAEQRPCAEEVDGRLKKRLFLYGPAHRA